ncbi:MAG TPA: hypothetical protein VIR65_08875 [Rhizorhapis sp.]
MGQETEKPGQAPDEPTAAEKDTPTYSATQARGGEIILRKRWERWVFIAGLVGFVLLAIILGLAS